MVFLTVDLLDILICRYVTKSYDKMKNRCQPNFDKVLLSMCESIEGLLLLVKG